MMAKNSFVAEVTFKCDESYLLMVPKQRFEDILFRKKP